VGEAALMDGFKYVGIELNPTYAETARGRLDSVSLRPPSAAKRERRTVPFGWYGGKSTHLPWLLPLLPRSVHYCEPFGGAASVLLHRDPSPIETYNDRFGEVAEFFRVLRDRPDELIDAISLTPFSRQEYRDALRWTDLDLDPVERARRFFVRARQSRYGKVHQRFDGQWSSSRAGSNRGMSSSISKWLGSIDGLHEIATRLRRVQIEGRPALDVIRAYDDRGTLFYCDPPYVHGSRGKKDSYGDFEMTDDEHRELAEVLNSSRGKVALSGYEDDLYTELYPARKWRKILAPVKRIANSTRSSREALWVNYRR
jgi:DNA adenine methylase